MIPELLLVIFAGIDAPKRTSLKRFFSIFRSLRRTYLALSVFVVWQTWRKQPSVWLKIVPYTQAHFIFTDFKKKTDQIDFVYVITFKRNENTGISNSSNVIIVLLYHHMVEFAITKITKLIICCAFHFSIVSFFAS